MLENYVTDCQPEERFSRVSRDPHFLDAFFEDRYLVRTTLADSFPVEAKNNLGCAETRKPIAEPSQKSDEGLSSKEWDHRMCLSREAGRKYIFGTSDTSLALCVQTKCP